MSLDSVMRKTKTSCKLLKKCFIKCGRCEKIRKMKFLQNPFSSKRKKMLSKTSLSRKFEYFMFNMIIFLTFRKCYYFFIWGKYVFKYKNLTIHDYLFLCIEIQLHYLILEMDSFYTFFFTFVASMITTTLSIEVLPKNWIKF